MATIKMLRSGWCCVSPSRWPAWSRPLLRLKDAVLGKAEERLGRSLGDKLTETKGQARQAREQAERTRKPM